jgi:hypothetical protein
MLYVPRQHNNFEMPLVNGRLKDTAHHTRQPQWTVMASRLKDRRRCQASQCSSMGTCTRERQGCYSGTSTCGLRTSGVYWSQVRGAVTIEHARLAPIQLTNINQNRISCTISHIEIQVNEKTKATRNSMEGIRGVEQVDAGVDRSVEKWEKTVCGWV